MGLAVSDGLEMRAIADGVGLVEGTVLALGAGLRPLCIGGGLAGEDVASELRDAIWPQSKGSNREARLMEARPGGRARRLAIEPIGACDSDRGIGLGRRAACNQRRRERARGGQPVVVQLTSTPSQAGRCGALGYHAPLLQLART